MESTKVQLLSRDQTPVCLISLPVTLPSLGSPLPLLLLFSVLESGIFVTLPCYKSGFVPPGTAHALPVQSCVSLGLEKKVHAFCAHSSAPPPDSGLALGLLEAS